MRNTNRLRLHATLMWFCLAAGWASGQLKLGLDVDPSTGIVHESLMARVTVENGSGAPLAVNSGTEAGLRLRLSVENDGGERAPSREAHPLPRLDIGPGGVQTLEVDLTMRFVMSQPDRYFVRAVLEGGATDVRSPLKVVDVVPGLELARTSGRVPGLTGVRRDYVLCYWPRDRKEQLFLCVTEAPSKRVFPPIYLGSLVRVMKPTITLGADGLVEVRHQANRSQVMVSTLRSRRDRLSLVEQRPVRLAAGGTPRNR